LWTFRAGKATLPQALKFGFVYGTNLGVNVGANATMLTLLPLVYPWRLDLAFLMATGTSAALNFIGMKWLAFAPRNK
jgi:putative flippase GtrA